MDDLIYRLAREAGFRFFPASMHSLALICPPMYDVEGGSDMTEELRRFAALVAEECAKECDGAADAYLERPGGNFASLSDLERARTLRRAAADGSRHCSRTIRAKFKEPTNG